MDSTIMRKPALVQFCDCGQVNIQRGIAWKGDRCERCGNWIALQAWQSAKSLFLRGKFLGVELLA